ncbi:MAG TPA: DUF1427 family protein [Acetobacteraceae bacterium]|jgi:XapX domain-containing protein|nr:DUF1427 family protein [Acetobacteraceae bacterium]
MNGFAVSVAFGFAVGAIYGLVQVRSPAPPVIALAGLLGMVPGQGAIDLARQHFRTQAQELPQPPSDDVRGLRSSHSGPARPTATL